MIKRLFVVLALLIPGAASAQYLDGLPQASSPLPGTAIVPVCQGGKAGHPGTCKTVQTTVGSFSLAVVNGLPQAPSNAALKAIAAGAYSTVYRAGFNAQGDGGAAYYSWSTSACSLNSGAGDNGAQVAPTTGTGCWIAQFPASGVDVRAWGAVADGATDAGPAINTALTNSGGVPIIIPVTPAGFYVNTTIVDLFNLIGESFNPYNPAAYQSSGPPFTYSFAGQAWLKCSATVSPCLQLGQLNDILHAPHAENIVLSMASGTPGSGTIGLQVAGGYNVNTRNIGVFNFDTCMQWGPDPATTSGIAAYHYLTIVGGCATHYFVQNGWPELHMIGGRAGMNGYGDYATAQEFWLFSITGAQGGGAGVNTTYVTSFQFNPAGIGTVACMLRWGGWTATGGNPDNEEYRFSDNHFEWHGTYSGTATQGFFCSDSTVNQIAGLQFTGNRVVATSSPSIPPIWNLSSATSWQSSTMDDNTLTGCGTSTLTLPEDTQDLPSNQAIKFSNNTFPCNVTFNTTANGERTLLSTNNSYNSLTPIGKWALFSSFGDLNYFGPQGDTATGNVQIGNYFPVSWTPVLNYGGTPASGATYSTNVGAIQRTPSGGFTASVNMILTNAGTGSGAVTITGLPHGCNVNPVPGTVIPNGGVYFTNLIGQLYAQMGTGTSPVIYVLQGYSTGSTPVAYTNMTNTSVLQFVVECSQAL